MVGLACAQPGMPPGGPPDIAAPQIVRITPEAQAEVVLSGSNMVGMALQPSGRAILATCEPNPPSGALFTLDWDVRGLPLLG